MTPPRPITIDVYVLAFPVFGTLDVALGQELAAELTRRGVGANAICLEKEFADEGLTTTDVLLEACRRAHIARCVVGVWSAHVWYCTWMPATLDECRHKTITVQTDPSGLPGSTPDVDLQPWLHDRSQSHILDKLVTLVKAMLAKPENRSTES
jgi:hypothetical protein